MLFHKVIEKLAANCHGHCRFLHHSLNEKAVVKQFLRKRGRRTSLEFLQLDRVFLFFEQDVLIQPFDDVRSDCLVIKKLQQRLRVVRDVMQDIGKRCQWRCPGSSAYCTD